MKEFTLVAYETKRFETRVRAANEEDAIRFANEFAQEKYLWREDLEYSDWHVVGTVSKKFVPPSKDPRNDEDSRG